jgi:hypothetical protein
VQSAFLGSDVDDPAERERIVADGTRLVLGWKQTQPPLDDLLRQVRTPIRPRDRFIRT